MENLLEMAGVVMARLYMIYGMVFLILPLLSFAYVIVLAGVIWTVAARHSESLINSGAIVIEARGVYRASGGEREVRLATLRANPAFAGNH